MIWNLTASFLLLAALVACGQAAAATGSVQSHGGPVKDHVSFVDHLRAAGLTVDIIGPVQQPFLRAKGTTLRIGGGQIKQPTEVQSYNYDDTDLGTDGAKAALADARGISSDGSPARMTIDWIAPPHFFHQERVIVIYVGNDPAMLKVLTDSLGSQFAGR